jgi:hypothetical protein
MAPAAQRNGRWPASFPLVVQNNADQRAIHLHVTAVVIDEAQLAEAVEEEADTGAGGTDHFR